MKIIHYTMNGVEMSMPFNDANIAIAESEADKDSLRIEDDGQPEPVAEPTTDDILNALLGVNRYA